MSNTTAMRRAIGGAVTKYNRNNTNFTTQLFEHFKGIVPESKYSFLKYYQNLVRDFMHLGVARGILINHHMGLGKSILAVAIAMDLMAGTNTTGTHTPKQQHYEPIVLLTKSLQDNMIGSIHKYINMRRAVEPDYMLGVDVDMFIKKHFSFVSMNASNMLKQVNRAAESTADEIDAAMEKRFGEILKMSSLDGKLLVVDEAHNFFRAITNGSKNAIGLYNMIMRAKNIRVVFLTGTPIANDPFELSVCFNMLDGSQLFPELYKDFNKLYVDSATGTVRNKGKFQNRIYGLVSYVGHDSKPGSALGIDGASNAEFPEELPLDVVRVHMDSEQYVLYQLARDKERDEGTSRNLGVYGKFRSEAPASPLVKPKGGASSTYRVRSRQLSNFAPPPAYIDEKDPNRIPVQNLGSAKYRSILANIMKHVRGGATNATGLVYSQFTGVGGLGTFSAYLRSQGWEEFTVPVVKAVRTGAHSNSRKSRSRPTMTHGICENYFHSDVTYELPEVSVFFSNVRNQSRKYSGGVDDGDAGDIDTNDTADTNDITDIDNDSVSPPTHTDIPKSNKLRYAIISGNVDTATRTAIQNIFNSEENKHGGIIDLILVSSTGAEGLDLKNGRHVHIMEMYWNWSRISQIIARLVRNNSHVALSADEKNVQPYLYLAIPPVTEKLPDGSYPDTTDVELYNDALVDQKLVDAFIEALREVSIECTVNGESYCRVCNPTNSPLYTADPERDVLSPDPCTRVREVSVKAEEVDYNGTKYYYVADKSSLYDYKIYEYDEAINGYRPLSEANPLYELIVDVIVGVNSATNI